MAAPQFAETRPNETYILIDPRNGNRLEMTGDELDDMFDMEQGLSEYAEDGQMELAFDLVDEIEETNS